MSIVRKAKRRSNFTVISNEVPQNAALSFRAVGLWTYLMTKPDHWKAKVEHLAEQHTEGREAVRAALIELEHAGYVVRRWVRRPGSSTPIREYVVYETLEEAGSDRSEGGKEVADCDHPAGLPRNPSSRPAEPRHGGFPGTRKAAALVSTELEQREEEESDDEAEIERYCAAHGLDPAEAIDDEPAPPLPDLDDQLVAEIARRALELRTAEKPTDPVRLPGRWLERAEGRIHRSDEMRTAGAAVRHPALGCAGRPDQDALQLEALVYVHRNKGAWPARTAARRHVEPDPVSTSVDSPDRTPMPASVRDALARGAR